MKKVLSIILVCFCIITSMLPMASAAAEKATKKTYNVVKYVSKEGKTVTDSYDQVFNSKGQLTTKNEKSSYDEGTSTYSYDSKGRISKITKKAKENKITYTETTTFVYDSLNNVTSKERVLKIGSIKVESDTYNFTYDEKSNLISEKIVEISGLEKTTISHTYTYDSKNRVVKYVYSDNEYGIKTSGSITYKFDSKGNVIKETKKETEDGVTSTKDITNTYNDNNQLIKSINIDKNPEYGNSKEVYEYTYDSKGNEVKRVYTYEDDDDYTAYTETVSKYNSKNLIVSEVTTDRDIDGEIVSNVTYKYNAAGLETLCTTTKVDEEGTSVNKTTTTYDSKNRVIKIVTDNTNSMLPIYRVETYAYDDRGNIIKESNIVDYKFEDGAVKYSFVYNYTYDENNNLVKIVSTTPESIVSNVSTTSTETFTYEKAKASQYEYDTGASTFNFVVQDQTYTGKALKPAITVSEDRLFSDDEFLCQGVDYKVKYSNNTEVGKAKIIVSFIGDYEGISDVELTFNIKKPLPNLVGLKASSIKKDSLKLTWTAISGAKYYKVEQSTDGKTWKTIKTTTTNSLTINELKAGSKYQYRVTALNSSKKAISKVSTVLKTGTLTSAPTVTLKSSKSKTVTASWKKVTGASKYSIYKSTDNKTWTKVTDTTKLTYDITKLSGGKKIYVKVSAVNAYGKAGSASKVVSITVKK